MTITLQPRIYVADLAAYNNGKLHGIWIDAAQDPDEIRTEIEQMLANSSETVAEDWAIHDFEGFEGISLSEYESIDKISELAQAISEHGKAYAVYVNYHGLEYSNLDDFQEAYCGCYDSEEDFVQELWEETGRLKALEALGISSSYINWENIATDLFIDSYFSVKVSYQEVYVFHRY